MNRLPDNAVRLIGSTQVITSVYSVIKELLENSLDAGATSVEVKLDSYGLDKIEVRDNGCGIHPADVPVFAKRHFTSKINSHADLEALTTYGFRGEALASLCAVSEVSVTTKTTADDISQTYTLNSEGEVTSTVPSHLGQGTTVSAKGLFRNLPVRKQYHNATKKKKEDLKNVENLLIAYGVILPKVRFSLRHNKEMVWQKVVLQDSAAVLKSIYGTGVMSKMEWRKHSDEDLEMEIEICVPKPGSDVQTLSRSTADRSFLSVNGRPVTVKNIDKLIRQYYSNCHTCDISRHPVYYLRVSLPAKDVDVNLEPNKTTVMTTNMNLLLERLEEMLLYVYGPLDHAPSWRYKDADVDSRKPPAAKTADTTPQESLESATKGHSDDGASSGIRDAESSSRLEHSRGLGGESKSSRPGVASKETSLSSCCPDDQFRTDVNSRPRSESDSPQSACLGEKPGSKTMNTLRASSTDPRSESGLPLNGSEEKEDSFEALSKKIVDDFFSTFPENEINDSKGSYSAGTSSKSVSKDVLGRSSPTDTSPHLPKCADHSSVERAKVTDEDEGGSRVIREPSVAGPSGWSHGTSVRSGDGSTVQPVRLLVPSAVGSSGKRSLSPSPDSGQKQVAPPEKRGRRLCPAQSTLYDVIHNQAVKQPLSAKDIFMKEKRGKVVEQNPEADYEKVTDLLNTMWEELSEEMRVPFQEKCWNDTQRYKKEVESAKGGQEKNRLKSCAGAKSTSVRDMVAASSTQPIPKPAKRKKVEHRGVEMDTPFTMDRLCKSLSEPVSATPSDRGDRSHVETKVLAYLQSCKTWLCTRGDDLCMLNIHRLSEAVVYQRLLNQHKLPVHHCQSVQLSPGNTGGWWGVLESLVERQASLDVFIHLTDVRITANGFDVKCWKDSEGSLCAELVGVCGDVPTYGVKDLAEVLEVISNSPAATLAQCRPLKVVNFLKGEAVRMVRKEAGERSVEDVEALLEEGCSFLSPGCVSCLHGRPFFHTLLANYDLATVSQQSPEPSGTQTTAEWEAEGCGKSHSEDGSRVESQDSTADLTNSDTQDQVMCLDDLMDSD